MTCSVQCVDSAAQIEDYEQFSHDIIIIILHVCSVQSVDSAAQSKDYMNSAVMTYVLCKVWIVHYTN